MRRRVQPPAGLPIEATQEQVEAARARLTAAFEGASEKAGIGMDEAAPRLREVLAGLPQLRPVLGLAVELRAPILFALVEAGATVPRETWERLGVARMYQERSAPCGA